MRYLQKILILCIAILCFVFSTQAQISSEKLIDVILNSYHRDSEKATYPQILDSLQKIAQQLKNTRVNEYLELVRMQHSFETAESQIEKNRILNLQTHLAEQSKLAEVKGFYYILRGQYAFGEKQFADSLPFYLQARKLLEDAQYDKLPYATYFYNHFFDVYYYFEDFKTAAWFCEKALKKPDLDLYSHYGYYNNLGLCYIKLKAYDKAEDAFKNGILASRKRNYRNFEALVLGNLGNLKRLQGHYKEALPLLYADAHTNEKLIPENAAVSKLYIAQCLIKLDSVAKAKQFIKAPDFIMPVWSYPGYDLMKYETLAMFYDEIGNFRLGSMYKDSLMALKEILKVRLDSKKLIILESNLKIEKERIAYENSTRIRNFLLAMVIVVFVGIVFWLNNKRKKNQEIMTRNLAVAKAEMESYLNIIKEKNAWIERINEEMESKAEYSGVSENEAINQYLTELNQSVILTKEDWDEFKELFEKIYPDFFGQISTQYPDLTAAEIRLLALEKLNLSSKVMGNMLGILPASVRKTRYRLRKKYSDLSTPESRDEHED